MKKILCLVVLTAFMLSIVAINVCAKTTNPQNLLILGDSISTGYGLAGYPTSDNSYGRQLANAFGLTGSAYTDLAVDGTTTGDLLTTLSNPSSSETSSLSAADTIVISTGGNDVLKPIVIAMKKALNLPATATNAQLQAALATNPNAITQIVATLQSNSSDLTAEVQTFGDNLQNIIHSIRQVNSKAKVYVQTIYNPFSGVTGYEKFSTYADTLLGQMNSVITSKASVDGYAVVDVSSAFQNKALSLTNISKFDIHPNEAGHTAIFNLVYTAITGRTYAVPATSSTISSGTSSVMASATASSSSQRSSNPKTGDGSGPDVQFIIMASIAALTCVSLAILHKSRKAHR